MTRNVLGAIAALFVFCVVAKAQITTTAELVDAVNNGSDGDVVDIGAGVFVLAAPLTPKAGMHLRGRGADQTVITAADDWQPGIDDLPDNAVNHTSVNRNAYLIDLGDNRTDVIVSDLTLTAPALHGAIYGNNSDRIELRDLRFDNFLWSAVRLFRMDGGRIHDNTFIDAGGRSQVTSGQTGGAVFITFTSDSELFNNLILKTADHPGNFFGFKGRKATNTRFYHNTVLVGFSLELPFENDLNVEIDHNYFTGPISIPKFAGGPVYEPSQRSFHIHHNWLTRSYALEWARNSAQVNSNLFDFSTADDGGNLVANFGTQPSEGPTFFFNNRIRNPGRGVFWSEGPFDRFFFYNNHVIADTLTRTSGFFGLDRENGFNTVMLRDNVIENTTLNPRPLMRNEESYAVAIANNRLVGVSDTARYDNASTGDKRGPLERFFFRVGVDGEYQIDGWNVYRPLDSARQIAGAAGELVWPGQNRVQRVRPFAGADQFAMPPGKTLTVPAPGVLRTDSNLHMGAATLVPEVTRSPQHGVLSLNEDGGFTYVPDPGFVGVDTFAYTVTNGLAVSLPADVELRVEPPSGAALRQSR